MRRLSMVLSLILVAFVVFSGNERATAQYASSSVFTETSYDFKGIPRYTTPKHSFIFQNNSQEDLRLVAVRTSCQCTQVFIPEKRVYKSGEKGEVVAQIDAVRFTGARHATVTVTFERGGRQFEVPLNVVGMVLENVRVEPQKLNMVVDEIKPGTEVSVAARQSRSQQASVLYPGNETVVRADSSNPYVSVQIGKAVRTNSGTQTPIVVSIKDNAPGGYINAVVHLWSNGAYSSNPLSLNVSGSVRAQLSVSPSTLTFYRSNDGKKVTKNVVVSATSEFTLKRVVSDSRAIECNISPKAIRPARVCVIPITFDPAKLQNEAGMTKVHIETVDGRALVIDAQISSANFDELGLQQTDRNVELVEFDENATEETLVAQETAPVKPQQEQQTAVAEPPKTNQANARAYQRPQSQPYRQSRSTAPFAAPFGGLFQ